MRSAVRIDGYALGRAGPADAEVIRALDGLSGSTRRLLDRDLRLDDRRCVVARDGASGEVVGVALVAVAVGEAHLLDVAVDRRHRRRGVATALVGAVAELARDELGAAAVTLEVRRSNAAARALYRRLGFTETGGRPDYYPDGPDGGREAAVIMWADARTA